MSRFISGSVNWLRRSFSEHDGGLNSNSRNDSNSANSNNNNNGKCEKLKRFANSFDVENLLLEDSSTPNLIGGPSHVLTDVNLLIPLSNYFPSRILGADWILNFSTAQDGFSLGSLYRRLAQGRVDSPALLAILDTEGTAFGALVSEPFRVQEAFYGTGQSFLFRLKPDFQVWPWSTDNDFFISCSSNSLRIGAGDGHFGISIDEDLNMGRTQRCATYNNDPLVESEDFVIKSLEIWTFSS
nr:LOW QUALITY PROTEIN: TLD domain-containing protein 2-like [Lepeophtheirus salmonis]